MAKVLVSLDDQLLRRLDAEAATRRVSRSALIAQLAAKGLGIAKGPGAHPDVRKALKETDELFAEAAREEPYYRNVKEDSTVTIRKMRDSR
jgi:hypothetical protein